MLLAQMKGTFSLALLFSIAQNGTQSSQEIIHSSI
jgi:hypothetical protein